MRNRCYFSKAGFEETRLKIEDYVKSRGVVTREAIIDKFKYRGLPMNNKQLGFILHYSEKRGILTSFVRHWGRRTYDIKYYVTTIDKLNNFIGDKKNE